MLGGVGLSVAIFMNVIRKKVEQLKLISITTTDIFCRYSLNCGT